jgi:hypothetical protein
MKDIHQVLRRKRAQYAQLTKEIQLLEDAERKLQEVAALLSDGDEEEDSAVLAEVDDESSQTMGMGAGAAPSGADGSPSLAAAAAAPSLSDARPRAPRWP